MLNDTLLHARAQVEHNMVKRILRLPSALLYRVAGGRPDTKGDRTLAAQMQVMAFADRQMRPLHTYPVRIMRKRFNYLAKMLSGPRRAEVFTTRRRIFLNSEAGGRRELEIRLYTPHCGPYPKPVLVYYHGGGWCLGSAQSHEPFCQHLAAQADVIVVSVDYRLAPEHPFPLPAEDAIDAFQWVYENAEHFAGRSDCLLVGGDSAGGNLAAVVAQQTKHRGLPPPQGQVLIYPATDLRRQSHSHREMGEGYVLTSDFMRWFVNSYLGSPAHATDPLASPLLASKEMLERLPPAAVFTCGFDPLRDEGEAYAQALQAHDVPVHFQEFAHVLHGFTGMMGVSPDAREVVGAVCTQIRQLIARLDGIQS